MAKQTLTLVVTYKKPEVKKEPIKCDTLTWAKTLVERRQTAPDMVLESAYWYDSGGKRHNIIQLLKTK